MCDHEVKRDRRRVLTAGLITTAAAFAVPASAQTSSKADTESTKKIIADWPKLRPQR